MTITTIDTTALTSDQIDFLSSVAWRDAKKVSFYHILKVEEQPIVLNKIKADVARLVKPVQEYMLHNDVGLNSALNNVKDQLKGWGVINQIGYGLGSLLELADNAHEEFFRRIPESLYKNLVTILVVTEPPIEEPDDLLVAKLDAVIELLNSDEVVNSDDLLVTVKLKTIMRKAIDLV